MKNSTLDALMSNIETKIYMMDHALTARRRYELYMEVEVIWSRIRERFIPKRLRGNV